MNKFKYIIMSFIFILSLILTEKVVNKVKDKDPIMTYITSNQAIEPVNAVIEDDEIIPGISGIMVDKYKSYNLMKQTGGYNENLLIYKYILPDISLINNYDKYIISGNKINRDVSFVIYIAKDISKVKNITDKINIFLDSNLLINGYIDIPNIGNVHIYNGGTYKNYTDVNITWVNEVIESYYNESLYCLNLDKNKSNLDICSKNKMYTIKPSLYLDSTDIKSKITAGSIIYVDESNIKYLSNMIKYVKQKGYNLVYLDSLLEKCKA